MRRKIIFLAIESVSQTALFSGALRNTFQTVFGLISKDGLLIFLWTDRVVDAARNARKQMEVTVSEAESGQKLLNCLQRRLNLPPNLLHRWLRTGQIRLNGGRRKPFERVQTGDIIRLPPFAVKMAFGESGKEAQRVKALEPGKLETAGLPLLPGAQSGIWAIDKPRGLPVQGGSGHEDSVDARLREIYAGGDFIPTPAHRLDKDTGGVLLIGASYSALRQIQDNLHSGKIRKEYIAWVDGLWPWRGKVLLRHYLAYNPENTRRPARMADENEKGAREALCVVRPLILEDLKSLLHILLLTGRRHQIRLQLAAMGHPVYGDPRYGKGGKNSRLFLHSLAARMQGGFEYKCLPPWKDGFGLEKFPPELCPGMTIDEILQISRPDVRQEIINEREN